MKRYIPNCITALRIVLAPVLALSILKGGLMISLLVAVAIILSDISDGAMARALGACTGMGARLDVIADVTYFLSALSALNIMGLAPVWFTAIVLIKFAEFYITSALLRRHSSTSDIWVFDITGRAFAMLAMAAPCFFCLSALNTSFARHSAFFTAAVCALGLFSCFARIGLCIKKASRRNRPEALPLPALGSFENAEFF